MMRTRDGAPDWRTKAATCSSTDAPPCHACPECLLWERAPAWVPPPDYPDASPPWVPVVKRRRFGG